MSDGGHRTSTISRPTPAGARPGGRRADLTTPIPREKQLARAWSSKLVMSLIGLVVVVALAAALFVLPVRDWMRQRDDLGQRREELAILERANQQLQGQVDRLETPEGIEQAAREEIGYIAAGEERHSVLPLPDAPTTLPSGWPYDHVTQIITIRAAEAAAAATVSTSPPSNPASSAAVAP